MLNIPILEAAQRGDWAAVDSMLFNTLISPVELTECMLSAASQDDWHTVMLCLDINKRSPKPVLDITARHNAHPERWRLFDYGLGKYIQLPIIRMQKLDTYLMIKYGVMPSYDLEVFRYAKAGNWTMVFNHLTLNKIKNGRLFDIHARDEFHPQGWRLFDYAEAQDPSIVIQLWQYGPRPSYDIKLFQAAKTGQWDSVFYYIDNKLVDVNLVDESDPLKRTVLNHAIEQGSFEAINGLLIYRGAKETPINDAPKPENQANENASLAPTLVASSAIPLVQRSALPLEARTNIDQTGALLAPQVVYSIAYNASIKAPKPLRLLTGLEQFDQTDNRHKQAHRCDNKQPNSYNSKGFF